MKNSEFNRIMHTLSWRGARGKPKGFDNKKALLLEDFVKNDLVKKIIKNRQAIPVSLITKSSEDLLKANNYTKEFEDSFYGKSIKIEK